MQAEQNNNQQIDGQVNTKFGESGNWHDASELSRKDAAPAATAPLPKLETVLAEQAINPDFKYSPPAREEEAPAADLKDQAKDAANQAKDSIKEGAEQARDQAAGIAAVAQQKAGEIAQKAGEILHTAYDKATDLAAPVLNTASAAKDVIVEKASDALHTATDAFHTVQNKAAELTGLAPNLHDALDRMKQPESSEPASGERTESMPTGPLSDISAAQLAQQKANILYNADVSKMTDSSLPLGQRAAAAADAVAQKATALYEAGVIAASNLRSTKTEEAAPAQQAPPAQASQ